MYKFVSTCLCKIEKPNVRIKTILCNESVRKFNILKSCYHKLISLLSSNFLKLNLYISYSHLCYLFYYLIHWSRADEYSMFSSVCANWIPVITSEWPESNYTDCIICLFKVIYCRTIFTWFADLITDRYYHHIIESNIIGTFQFTSHSQVSVLI